MGVLKSEQSKLLAKSAELEPAVQREKQRADGGAEQAGRLSDALAREKGRADAAAQELGGLRDELAALRKGESRLAEISAVVENERRRAKAAVAEVALLKSEQAKLFRKVPSWSKPSNARNSGRTAARSRLAG